MGIQANADRHGVGGLGASPWGLSGEPEGPEFFYKRGQENFGHTSFPKACQI